MAGWIRKAAAVLRAPANKLAFAARRRRAHSAGLPRLGAEPMGRLFDFLTEAERPVAERREAELRARYALDDLRRRSTRHEYREAIDLLDVLDGIRTHVPAVGARPLRAVDVGARNWTYVGALERFYVDHAQALELTGVEVDGHPVYRDGHARCDYARAYARATGNPGVRYEVGDFCAWESHGSLDIVTMFYPFLTRYALLDWGLPNDLFTPEQIVARGVDVLADGGILVSLHQTILERGHMLAWLADHPVEVLDARHAAAWLVPHAARSADRHVVVARKIRE